jgi:uncharacterized protein (DUF2062 family)
MTVTANLEPPEAVTPRPGFWQRRVGQPVLAQLRQGVAPDTIALSLGVGTACSLFPFLGFTTLLNLGVGLALRMNQPILQTVNVLLAPAQLALILVYVRAGELIWRDSSHTFSVGEMLQVFKDASLTEFLSRFGWAGVHALTAWLITSPVLVAIITLSVRPLLRRLAPAKTP